MKNQPKRRNGKEGRGDKDVEYGTQIDIQNRVQSATLCTFTDLKFIVLSTFLHEQKRMQISGDIRTSQHNNSHP